MSGPSDPKYQEVWQLFAAALYADIPEDERYDKVKPLLAHYTSLDTLEKESDEIDIVLSDVTMPGMNGIDLSYHIRERFPAMPVAIVSGDVSELERSIIGRFDVPFIKKPFHAESSVE